jgi:hypothetical protein
MIKKWIDGLKYKTLVEFHQSDANKIKKKINTSQFEEYLQNDLLPNLGKWQDSPSKQRNAFILKPVVKIEFPGYIDDCCGVIVETRAHEYLIKTLKNYFEVVDRPALLFCSKNNLPLIIGSELKDKIGKELFPILIENEDFGIRSYNELFLSKEFWNVQPKVEKILVFQTDGYFNPSSKYKFTDFFKYDYIGANWFYRIRTNGLIIDGGVGGVSLRNQHLSRQAVKRFAELGWEGGEDDFFGFYIELLGGRVGRKRDCDKFCQQHKFRKHTFSAHQPSNMNNNDALKFITAFPNCYLNTKGS